MEMIVKNRYPPTYAPLVNLSSGANNWSNNHTIIVISMATENPMITLWVIGSEPMFD